MFYLVGIFRILSQGDGILSDPERTALRRRGEEPGYTEVFQQRAGSLNSKSEVGLVTQLCLTLCDPKDCGPPGSSVHGISPARILEWVITSCSREAQLIIHCYPRR